ncbi:MAG: phosphate regulon transcriptional regulator PhoB [Alphaproteobacteria bacterium]|nr:phosphate regulon transcriptional regulator PhoB [Alphaproteobacteria bacterium]
MNNKILIVEDEKDIRDLIIYSLEGKGYQTISTDDGEKAIKMLKENKPDLVILDWMLPSVSGLEICRSIRRDIKTKNIPIIMLTAKITEEDKVLGLDSGADDYITKPFSTAELNSRVKAILRRIERNNNKKLKYADIEMDLVAHKIIRNGRKIKLGPKEFKLLKNFLEQPQRVFSRDQLLDKIWGENIYVEPRTVDVHIRRLRKAITANNEINIIRTVRDAGYSLEADV